LFILALLSKPTAMVVPLIAGVLDAIVCGRPLRRVVSWLWPWLLLSAACAAVTKALQPGTEIAVTVALWQRPFVAADALAFYLYKLLDPVWLGMDYGRRPVVVLEQHHWAYVTWLAPAAAALALWLWRRRAPQLAA